MAKIMVSNWGGGRERKKEKKKIIIQGMTFNVGDKNLIPIKT
jgi:hypothetical protein